MALDIPEGLVVELADLLKHPVGFTAGAPCFVFDTPAHGEVMFTARKNNLDLVMCIYPPNAPKGQQTFKTYKNLNDVLLFMGYNNEEMDMLFGFEPVVTNVVDIWTLGQDPVVEEPSFNMDLL